MKHNFLQACCLTLILLTQFSFGYVRNEDLRAQISSQTGRVLPSSDLFSAAIDGHLFYRNLASYGGYYHGGYWIDAYVEVTPWKQLALNGKFVLYDPAASFGVTGTSYIHPNVTVRWNESLGVLASVPVNVRSLFFYLDRQTLGAGLTLEDKEMSGMLIEARRDWLRVKYLQDGTGGYNIGGDVRHLSLDLSNDLIGLALFEHQEESPAFFSIYSLHPLIGDFSYFTEVGRRHERYAGLLGVKHQKEWARYLSSRLRLQARRYESGYAEGIKGKIEHDYLSIEQEDKSYTNSENVFVWNDDVNVASCELGLTLRPYPWLRLDTDNEYYLFSYRSSAQQSGYLYRHSVGICPNALQAACAYLVYSNKMTSAEFPLSVMDGRNIPYFLKRTYLALEARFSL